ncbi:MAG: YtxH domain-containing protein [Chitinophagaceae bacterium]
MTTGTKVALGIIGAVAAGVVIGLLIAPEKGSDMRKRIAKTAGDWTDQLTHLFQKGSQEADELREKARNMKAAAESNVSRVKESLG